MAIHGGGLREIDVNRLSRKLIHRVPLIGDLAGPPDDEQVGAAAGDGREVEHGGGQALHLAAGVVGVGAVEVPVPDPGGAVCGNAARGEIHGQIAALDPGFGVGDPVVGPVAIRGGRGGEGGRDGVQLQGRADRGSIQGGIAGLALAPGGERDGHQAGVRIGEDRTGQHALLAAGKAQAGLAVQIDGRQAGGGAGEQRAFPVEADEGERFLPKGVDAAQGNGLRSLQRPGQGDAGQAAVPQGLGAHGEIIGAVVHHERHIAVRLQQGGRGHPAGAVAGVHQHGGAHEDGSFLIHEEHGGDAVHARVSQGGAQAEQAQDGQQGQQQFFHLGILRVRCAAVVTGPRRSRWR